MKAGERLGTYDVIALLGTGGPPPLARAVTGELRRGLAGAQTTRTS